MYLNHYTLTVVCFIVAFRLHLYIWGEYISWSYPYIDSQWSSEQTRKTMFQQQKLLGGILHHLKICVQKLLYGTTWHYFKINRLQRGMLPNAHPILKWCEHVPLSYKCHELESLTVLTKVTCQLKCDIIFTWQPTPDSMHDMLRHTANMTDKCEAIMERTSLTLCMAW